MMKPTSNSQRYVVIRPFVKGDEVECKRIIQQMCMSMVNRTFLAALFRETTFQLMVFFAAILFIIVGVPFGYCAVSAPLTITFLYVLVWSNAMMKSMELQNEVALMKQQYQQSDKTECFVAEYYGPLLDLDSKAPIVFTNPHDIQVHNSGLRLLENVLLQIHYLFIFRVLKLSFLQKRGKLLDSWGLFATKTKPAAAGWEGW